MYHIHEHVELHHSKKFTWFHQFSSGFSCRCEILAKTASSARRRTSQNCGLHRICNLARKPKCLVRPLGNCPVPPHSLPSLHLKPLQKCIIVNHSISFLRDFVVFDRPLSQALHGDIFKSNNLWSVCFFCIENLNYFNSLQSLLGGRTAYTRNILGAFASEGSDALWFVFILWDLSRWVTHASRTSKLLWARPDQREGKLVMHWLSSDTNCEALKTWATRRWAVWSWHELATKMHTRRRCAGDSRTVPGFASPNCWKPTLAESFKLLMVRCLVQIDGSTLYAFPRLLMLVKYIWCAEVQIVIQFFQ